MGMKETGLQQHAPETVLIVDDTPANIQLAASALRSNGYRLAFAQNGPAALEQIARSPIDLVLLDVMMPEMDGFEVCRRLKADPKTVDIPVIFLTAATDLDSITGGFELGAVDYVVKPFNTAELVSRVKTHLELKRNREALREMIAAKDTFFSIMSHDLKSAIFGLSGLSANLLDRFDALIAGELSEKKIERMRHSITVLEETSNGAMKLLENLLEWSRTQTGRIQVVPQRVALEAVVQDTFSLLANAAQLKEIKLRSEIASDAFAMADLSMLYTVLRNLLSNAIKFSHSGGTVAVTIQRKEAEYEVTVADTGVGMKPEDIARLFRIDSHFSTPGTASERGTGLGLLLVREFVEQNGGTIRVESEPSAGSRFIFTVPAG